MIHYHQGNILDQKALVTVATNGHVLITFGKFSPATVKSIIYFCQSFMIDNGAYSSWKSGNPISDWSPYYDFVRDMKKIPSFDFAIIPDVIDGSEEDNDRLIGECPIEHHWVAPVWHLHESLDRLLRLANTFPRVCLGSSGDYSQPNSLSWWKRINEAMNVVCDKEGYPLCKLHGLRMLNKDIFTRLPFSSADSSYIARNIAFDKGWNGSFLPPDKESRAYVLRKRVEFYNAPTRFEEILCQQQQSSLF